MFTIEANHRRKLIRADVSGFWTAGEVQDFSDQEQRLIRSLGWSSGEFMLLVNTTDALIQPQEVVIAFQAILMNSPLKAARIAVVKGGSLSGMQTRRILIREGSAHFETIQEAEAWLFEAA